MATERGFLRIGELSRRTGVSPELLRAWERRYGVLKPSRSEGGFRLYSVADEERVLRMLRHLGQGLSAAEAARLANDAQPGDDSTEEVPSGPLEGLAGDLAAALDRFDEAVAQGVFNRLFSLYSAEHVLREVVLPYLVDLGERWQTGRISIAQEHFASNVIRARLMALAGAWEQGSGPTAVLACLPGERHELGLLCFGVILRRRGWRIVYLGADTPVESLARVVTDVRPEAVVVVCSIGEVFEASRDELADLHLGATLMLAGQGAAADAVEAMGARLLDGDPVTVASSL